MAPTFWQRNRDKLGGFTFEMVSMGLFAYGIVCSDGSNGRLTLAFFGSLALCAPFSGGHINPAVTFAMWMTRQVSTGTAILYWIAQLSGAFGGALLCYLVTGKIDSPMVTDQSFHWVMADLAGETLGTFTFVLIILIQSNQLTTYSKQPLASLISISVALHLSRQYSSHSGGCINPGMAASLEFFQMIKLNQPQRLLSMWIFIAGPFGGSFLAVLFYKILYQPLYNRYKS
ncbi:water channel activity protein [Paramecium bursaria]